MTRFTLEEDQIIRTYYPIGGSLLVKKHLVRCCTPGTICNRAAYLGIRLSIEVKKKIKDRSQRVWRGYQSAGAAEYNARQKDKE